MHAQTGEWGSQPWGPGAVDVAYDWKADPEDDDWLKMTVNITFVGVGDDGLVDRCVLVVVLLFPPGVFFPGGRGGGHSTPSSPVSFAHTHTHVGHTHTLSGVNIFEVATYADATDYATDVIEACDLEIEGPEKVAVTFMVPRAHALAQDGASIVLRYAYKNKPCPALEDDDSPCPWCGLYSSDDQPALPFVLPLQGRR